MKNYIFTEVTPFYSFKNRILQLLCVLFKHSHVTINKTSFTCANVIYKIKYSQNPEGVLFLRHPNLI